MGKIIFDAGQVIDNVEINGDGFSTITEISPTIFSKENLKAFTFTDETTEENRRYDNMRLSFFFDLVDGGEHQYRFGFYDGDDKLESDSSKIGYLSCLLLSDEQAAQAPFLFDEWDPNGVVYTAEVSKVQYNGLLYKCLQSHTSQASWTPTDAPSLWVRIDDPAEEWPEWRQPTGSTDAYSKGDKVSHNGKHWISNVDGVNTNTWEPGMFGWDEQPSDE